MYAKILLLRKAAKFLHHLLVVYRVEMLKKHTIYTHFAKKTAPEGAQLKIMYYLCHKYTYNYEQKI